MFMIIQEFAAFVRDLAKVQTTAGNFNTGAMGALRAKVRRTIRTLPI